ncbi:MAG: hypothetical protein WAN11_04725, partial [Syntrophobacteraceae bacterium]
LHKSTGFLPLYQEIISTKKRKAGRGPRPGWKLSGADQLPIYDLALSSFEVHEFSRRRRSFYQPGFEQDLPFEEFHLAGMALSLFIKKANHIIKALRIEIR